jgi:hypothetical protein
MVGSLDRTWSYARHPAAGSSYAIISQMALMWIKNSDDRNDQQPLTALHREGEGTPPVHWLSLMLKTTIRRARLIHIRASEIKSFPREGLGGVVRPVNELERGNVG